MTAGISPYLPLLPYAAIAVFVLVMIALGLVRRPQGKPRRWPLPTFGVLVVVIVIHMSLLGGAQDQPARRAQPPGRAVVSLPTLLAVVGVPVAVVLGWVAWKVARVYDRDVARAWERRDRGDRDGAIAGLREAIAEKGPSVKRFNGLGALLIDAGEHDEACRVLRQAFAINPEASRDTLAIAVLQAGDPVEAEALYRPIVERKTPGPGPVHLANYAHVLAQLGRLDEAESYLDRADALLASGSGHYYLGGLKATVRKQVAENRAKIAELRGTRKDEIDLSPEIENR